MQWKRGEYESSLYVLTTSLPSSHCVYPVTTNYLPRPLSRAHHVQFLLRPFRSYHSLTTHLPSSHCVLSDLKKDLPRAQRSNLFFDQSSTTYSTSRNTMSDPYWFSLRPYYLVQILNASAYLFIYLFFVEGGGGASGWKRRLMHWHLFPDVRGCRG